MTGPARGWYRCPSGADQQRFWDGARWTQQVRPSDAVSPPSAAATAHDSAQTLQADPPDGPAVAAQASSPAPVFGSGWVSVDATPDIFDEPTRPAETLEQGRTPDTADEPSPSPAATEPVDTNAPRWMRRPHGDTTTAFTDTTEPPVSAGMWETDATLGDDLTDPPDRPSRSLKLPSVTVPNVASLVNTRALSWVVTAVVCLAVAVVGFSVRSTAAPEPLSILPGGVMAAVGVDDPDVQSCVATSLASAGVTDVAYGVAETAVKASAWEAFADCATDETLAALTVDRVDVAMSGRQRTCLPDKMLEAATFETLAGTDMTVASVWVTDPLADATATAFAACSLNLNDSVSTTLTKAGFDPTVADCVAGSVNDTNVSAFIRSTPVTPPPAAEALVALAPACFT